MFRHSYTETENILCMPQTEPKKKKEKTNNHTNKLFRPMVNATQIVATKQLNRKSKANAIMNAFSCKRLHVILLFGVVANADVDVDADVDADEVRRHFLKHNQSCEDVKQWMSEHTSQATGQLVNYGFGNVCASLFPMFFVGKI